MRLNSVCIINIYFLCLTHLDVKSLRRKVWLYSTVKSAASSENYSQAKNTSDEA